MSYQSCQPVVSSNLDSRVFITTTEIVTLSWILPRDFYRGHLKSMSHLFYANRKIGCGEIQQPMMIDAINNPQ